MLERAVAHLRQQRLSEAEAALQAVLSRWPGQGDALNFLGVLRHQQDRHDDAVALLKRAVDALPGLPGPLNNLGNILMATGRHAEAEAVYRRCLLLQPDFLDALANLAALCGKRGNLDEAARCYRACLRLVPDNPVYQHHLAGCLRDAPPARASDAYLQQVFDRAAGEFDARLDSLGYCAPQEVAALLTRYLPPPAGQFDIADLGCGTGQCGSLLSPWARRLLGCDLSLGMLEQARARGVFSELVQVELLSFLASEAAAWDGLVCTDTLIYVGDLFAVSAAVAKALRPGGWFAFTVEALPDDDVRPLSLQPHGRYAHRSDHIAAAVAGAGLVIETLQGFTVRVESGVGVPGWLVLASQSRGD